MHIISKFFFQMILPCLLSKHEAENSNVGRYPHQIFTAFCFQPAWKPLKMRLSHNSAHLLLAPKAIVNLGEVWPWSGWLLGQGASLEQKPTAHLGAPREVGLTLV